MKKNTRGYSIYVAKKTCDLAKLLGAKSVVIHPGSNSNKLKGSILMRDALGKLLYYYKKHDIDLLLENMSGQRNSLFYTIKDMISYSKQFPGLKFCFDTAHAFIGGMKIADSEMLYQSLKPIINRIGCLHFNDAATSCNSGNDKHESILGKGYVGINFFRSMINDERFKNIPKITECKNEPHSYLKNLKILASNSKITRKGFNQLQIPA